MYELLVEKCSKYMEEKGISQAKLAAKIGVAESTFSRWFKNTYPNPETISNKVVIFFDKEEKREDVVSVGKISYADTTISQKVVNVLEYCRLQRIIGTIYGDAGIGKTYTSKNWAKDKSDVIIVTANPTVASPKPFLKLLANKLKTTMVGGVDDIYMDITDKLDGMDMTIIIDESQHLTRKALEVIRSINDETGTAIIMIGNESIYNKMVGKQQAEFAQLFSRLGMRNCLMTDMFDEDDVQNVFCTNDSDIVKYLLSICRSKYGLRGAVNVYTNARNNNDISQKGLKAMAQVMGITA